LGTALHLVVAVFHNGALLVAASQALAHNLTLQHDALEHRHVLQNVSELRSGGAACVLLCQVRTS